MTITFKPLQTKERVEFLDLLRGFALLGILMVNMPLMNAPFASEIGDFILWKDPANLKALWIIRFFFTGKFYVLFSLLFGIGFYFFLKKAEETEKSILPIYRRRLGWLLLIGIMHVLLLWCGDILVFYALFGFVMTWFRKKSNKSLIIWAVVFLNIPIILTILIAAFVNYSLSLPEVGDQIATGFEESLKYMALLSIRAIEVYSTGSFVEIMQMRLTEYSNILGGILFFFPNVLAMFLIGVVLARKKVFENIGENKKLFIKLALFCLPVAVIGNWMLAHYAQKSSYVSFNFETVLYMIGLAYGGVSLAMIYLSVLAYCYYKGYFKAITNAIAKTGRMALTNYLMQSVIATTMFFSYGFGLYGKVNYWEGIIITISIYVIQILWSHFWLKYYRFGPMEWVWRSLTYWKKQKMKL